MSIIRARPGGSMTIGSTVVPVTDVELVMTTSPPAPVSMPASQSWSVDLAPAFAALVAAIKSLVDEYNARCQRTTNRQLLRRSRRSRHGR